MQDELVTKESQHQAEMFKKDANHETELTELREKMQDEINQAK